MRKYKFYDYDKIIKMISRLRKIVCSYLIKKSKISNVFSVRFFLCSLTVMS
jgi:hypothetical protein